MFLLNHHFVPGIIYQFPVIIYQFPVHTFGKQPRHFQSNWLTKYGLVYSQVADGGYCKYHVLFAKCETSVQAFGTLVNQPLTKKASDTTLAARAVSLITLLWKRLKHFVM